MRLLLDGGTGPRATDCRTEAENEVIGLAVLCLLPGFGLVAGRRLRRRASTQQGIDIARMERSGVWRFRPLWLASLAVWPFRHTCAVSYTPVTGANLAQVDVGVITARGFVGMQPGRGDVPTSKHKATRTAC